MSVKLNIFNALSKDDSYLLLSKHMPIGRMWSNVFNKDTNIGKLVYGLSIECYRISLLENELANEYDIEQTTKLISEWEKSVGIPNTIYKNTGSISDRRRNVKYLFNNFLGIQTAEDFVRLATYFGFDVNITNAVDFATFPLSFPILFFDSKAVKYTIIVNLQNSTVALNSFPLTFPISFSDGGLGFLKSIYNLVKPANCNVLYITKTSSSVSVPDETLITEDESVMILEESDTIILTE